MRRLLYRLLPVLCSFLAFAAVVGVKPACILYWYQPEVPAALRK